MSFCTQETSQTGLCKSLILLTLKYMLFSYHFSDSNVFKVCRWGYAYAVDLMDSSEKCSTTKDVSMQSSWEHCGSDVLKVLHFI